MSSRLSHSARLKQGKQCLWKLALAVIQLPQAGALSVTWVGTAPSVSVVCATNTGWGAEPCFWACIAELLPFKGESITHAELRIPSLVETQPAVSKRCQGALDMKHYDSKGLEWLKFLKALVSIRNNFQLGKVQYFPSAFYEWLDRVVLESESPVEAIHKNNKTKQTCTKKLSRSSPEPLGARGWENMLAAQAPAITESIQGAFWWSEKYELLCRRAAGRITVTHTRQKARAGLVSDIVFPLIEVSGPNSREIWWVGSSFRRFHWAIVSESHMNIECTAKNIWGFLSWRKQSASKNICGFHVVWE